MNKAARQRTWHILGIPYMTDIAIITSHNPYPQHRCLFIHLQVVCATLPTGHITFYPHKRRQFIFLQPNAKPREALFHWPHSTASRPFVAIIMPNSLLPQDSSHLPIPHPVLLSTDLFSYHYVRTWQLSQTLFPSFLYTEGSLNLNMVDFYDNMTPGAFAHTLPKQSSTK